MTKKAKTPSTAKQRIMDLLHDNPNGLTAREVRESLNLSEPIVGEWIAVLRSEGFVRRTLESYNTRRYYITGNVPTFGVSPMIALFNDCLAEVRA